MKSLKKIMVIFFLIPVFTITAQVDIKKAGGKVNQKVKDNKTNSSTEEKNNDTKTDKTTDKTNTSSSTASSNTKMDNGKGYFYTSFKPNGFKNDVDASEELFVRMNLGKTMIEYADANGFSSSHTAYGFITVSIDDKKYFTVGPIDFASNISKKWLYIDIPLNVKEDFVQKISADQSMLETNQDVWSFQQLFQENSIPKQYVAAAIAAMTGSLHTVKVEFGLGEFGAKEPKITISTGTVKVKVDEKTRAEMAKNGPKHSRPLDDSERGRIALSNENIVPKGSDVVLTVEIPRPFKYYNEKWCQSNTCDYDHGSVIIYAELDGEYLTRWVVDLWNDDYEVKKKFDLVIVPKNDAELGKSLSNFNSNPLVGSKNDNMLVYALYDKFYNPNFKLGEHELTIKFLSPNNMDLYKGPSFDATKEFFDHFTSPIAQKTVKFNLTDADRKALMASSVSKKLSHAGGAWSAVDAHLLKTTPTYDFATIHDVACQTEWKVTTNSLGVILYRTCKANMIYTNTQGSTRIVYGLEVKQNYAGGNYDKGNITDIIQNYYTADAGFLSTGHYPLVASKVK